MKALQTAILSPEAMYDADRYAIEHGVSGITLMEAAGAGVSKAIQKRWSPRRLAVLCGPGNNGGDGWEVAFQLRQAGWPVTVFSMIEPAALRGDAALAAAKWQADNQTLDRFSWKQFDLVVDGLFGAGLSRELEGDALQIAQARTDADRHKVVAIDVPSGLRGDGRGEMGQCLSAALTVTFHRLKPAHCLSDSSHRCGEVELVDIGVPKGWESAVSADAEINHPSQWALKRLCDAPCINKHSRGRVFVRTGPAGATGAARLAGLSALIGGAGFVTLLCPDEGALSEVVTAERSLVAKLDGEYDSASIVHFDTIAVLGPGAGKSEAFKCEVTEVAGRGAAVLDADALSAFEDNPERLFKASSPQTVLTPHEGEFKRLFADLQHPSKIDRTRAAAERSGSVVMLKGPDTVIASPDGQVRVNLHASPALATAGTGDLLAGLIAALMAQGLTAFDAASAGAWIHGEAGRRCGPGTTVETVLNKLPAALAHTFELQRRSAAQQRVCRAGG